MSRRGGNHDFCLSRSHYIDTDRMSGVQVARAGIKPTTSSPGVMHCPDWATALPLYMTILAKSRGTENMVRKTSKPCQALLPLHQVLQAELNPHSLSLIKILLKQSKQDKCYTILTSGNGLVEFIVDPRIFFTVWITCTQSMHYGVHFYIFPHIQRQWAVNLHKGSKKASLGLLSSCWSIS